METNDNDLGRAAEESDPKYMSTFGRGIRVLVRLSEGAATIREVSNDLGLPRPTVYRLVHTLRVHDLVRRDVSTDTYRVSPRILSITAAAIDEVAIRASASPLVRDLAAKFGATVHLAIYDHGVAVYIDKQEGNDPIRIHTEIGMRLPCHAAATGKVLLAHQSADEIERVLEVGLNRYTDTTITDATKLRKELSDVRASGHGVGLAEWREGIYGVAVPVRDADGTVIAALGFSGTETMLETKQEMVQALADAAERITSNYERGLRSD